METYDVVVIGGGVAGVAAACGAAEKGRKVCLIEKDQIGGPCIHRGLFLLRWMLALQEEASGPVDFPATVTAFQETAQRASENRIRILKENDVAIVKGVGTFMGKDQTRVVSDNAEEMIQCNRIVLATGLCCC